MPVSNSALVGEQTGCTKKFSKLTPFRPKESMFGVLRFVLPLKLKSPHPWSSDKITIMLGGFSVFGAVLQATKQKSGTISKMRIVFFILVAIYNWYIKSLVQYGHSPARGVGPNRDSINKESTFKVLPFEITLHFF